ncbi:MULTISPECIES: hypothetical protein [unclassified Bradyrhizobium]|uniref:hypothetical protein n=1 Tax=unclassified Bradyrhizobium TaxID=2631580 RepID=UPI0024E1165A|nr:MULTISPECIES: hypothetical protein [unclassified Bradyrhizobium]
MSIKESLLADIEGVLGGAIAPNLTAASQGADLYEAYIWSLVLQAAQSEGATISFWNVFDSPVNTDFVFRTSPGNIFSTAHPYSHAVISFQNCPALEAHVGVFVAGKSGVAHECDVAVLYSDEAYTCRQRSVHPRSTQVLLAVECKFYVQSSMGIGLARSFLGLTTEIMQQARFFVGVSESERVETLFAHHKKKWETGVSPIDRKQRYLRLKHDFEHVFRDFVRKQT